MIERLADGDSDVRTAAWELLDKNPQILEQSSIPLDAWLNNQGSWIQRWAAIKLVAHKPEPIQPKHAAALIERLADGNSDVRTAARELLEKNSHVFDILQLPDLLIALGKQERIEILQRIHHFGKQELPALMPFIEASHKHGNDSDLGLLRFIVYFLGGGSDQVKDALDWFNPRKVLSESDYHKTRDHLKLFIDLWPLAKPYTKIQNQFVRHLTDLVDKHEGQWEKEDLETLEKIQAFLIANETPSGEIDLAIQSLKTTDWLTSGTKIIALHATFWLVLIILYPRFPLIQAVFFWNPHVRKLLGAGYVGFLLTLIPFLRRTLFAPFKKSLLSDAALDNGMISQYYPNSLARRSDQDKSTARPVVESITELKGQILLIADSGLGKTMFLRNLVSKSQQVTVFLPAWKCEHGVLEAVQDKLHGPVKDAAYLRTLIHAGAIDVCIDGVNEVSPDTREKIRSFVENFFKGNIILTCQPIDWRPPSTTESWYLEPLTEDQIEEFLITRPLDISSAHIDQETYTSDCRQFLNQALRGHETEEVRAVNRRILSNPMDATMVASMLARKKSPDLFHLQEQQYHMMADDYKNKHVGNYFPLTKFSEQVYQMRINDITIIPMEEFGHEISVLDSHKMVLVHQYQDNEGGVIKEARFRHDKIMDYFIVQTFLGTDNIRLEEHLGDPRFRGVYFLLAQLLPIDAAQQLRESLIQYAADTKDHTVSDDFIKRLRIRHVPDDIQAKNNNY